VRALDIAEKALGPMHPETGRALGGLALYHRDRGAYGKAELALSTGRAEALRAAKRRLMHEPRYAHPYYWAAFIPAGDGQPLDRNAIVQRGDP
jgi:hypothetical protein